MKLLFFVVALLAILLGSLLLLPLLASASVQDPPLDGPGYYAAVLATFFRTWASPCGIAMVRVVS